MSINVTYSRLINVKRKEKEKKQIVNIWRNIVGEKVEFYEPLLT